MAKCYFGLKELAFLGHIIGEKGISPDLTKVEKIRSYPVPTTVKEVQRFHGCASYYRKFIKDFAKIAAPLYMLFRKDTPFIWGDEQQKAFETIREALITAPILAYPDTQAAYKGTKPFKIYTDACKDGLGAHLVQGGEDGKEYTIRYEARGTDNAMKNAAPTDLELAGVAFALEKFRPYILGTQFTLYTDHQPLVKMIQNKEIHNSTRGRRLAKILEYTGMEILYKPGKTNVVADTLSRIPTLENHQSEEWIE
jgi:hypothetical protein